MGIKDESFLEQTIVQVGFRLPTARRRLILLSRAVRSSCTNFRAKYTAAMMEPEDTKRSARIRRGDYAYICTELPYDIQRSVRKDSDHKQAS